MKRTTLSLAPSLLKALKELAHQKGVTLRKVTSDLLELGLKTRTRDEASNRPKSLRWHTQSMRAKIDYDDRDEILRVLDSGK